MSHRIAVVYEADADFRTGTELADRVLIEAIDWLDADLIAHQREWIGEVAGQARLTWKTIPRLAQAARIRAHGHIDGNPLEIDAGAARRAILYLKEAFDDLAGIVLLRDQDDQPERRLGLEQARSEHHGSPQVVVGLAVVEREAWVISGFEPQDEDEQARLDAERQALGFNPHERSHQLTACKDDTAPRSPKRVLRVLTGGHYDRERHCWNTTPLALLRERGTENGLVAFLDEVLARLAPLIGHVPGRTES
jgi:hypothetical protein